MAKTYFVSKSDVNINKDNVAANPDVHIQFYEFEGKATLTATTSNANVLTMAGEAFTVSEFVSTMAKNLVLVDDNGNVSQTVIDANTATTITFDEATLLNDDDGVTVAALTISTIYDIYILTPSDEFTVGPFFGLTEGVELTLTDEMMKYKFNIPVKMLFQDLKERTGELNGGTISIMNEDVISTILGATQFGSQTGQWALGVGSNPDTNRNYRMTLLGDDRVGRQYQIIMRKTQISIQGTLLGSSEAGYKMAGFKFDLLSDQFYPDGADMVQFIRAN